ncbi:MAG: efflux RND transporter permease subunit [Desulfarculaceae bacterium]|nr:efflux RND transporter permease subunit [Desulfarculaceae bacterium]MCF8070752.1 efflux RND transporter permease subunit [Desulfarculaceae bacterium]MCF8102189.1 efflux RND transporter permease subunit [Desulfarculaceae bacterium]MCF8117012.1 efflux RND transporter permease subunit [Desulfarculaceae bacterium]
MPADPGQNGEPRLGLMARLVRPFVTSQLSLLLMILAVCLGAAAIMLTPREEEPQIVVPLADVMVSAPGASAAEVERLVTTPLERLLWQIDGVEHVYSQALRGRAVVTVRFFVGQHRERSLIKLYNKIAMNTDMVPSVVKGWVVKPVEIDDVPIVSLTLHSSRYSDYQLRRMAEEMLFHLSRVPDISRTDINGGRPRQVRVELDPQRLAAHGITPLAARRALAGADAASLAGKVDQADQVYRVTSDAYMRTPAQVGSLVVGVRGGRPVYLRNVARILDGPAEAKTYTRMGFGRGWLARQGKPDTPQGQNAVTISLAKKRGTNAVSVANDILARAEKLKEKILPAGVELTVTRNYGQTAQVKSDELMNSLFFAVLTVVALLAFTLGWREALVVAIAVPLSFAMALFVNYLFGYTINRVTMFALILSLGLVVDDPITNVDNIQRHIVRGLRNPLSATLVAVNEVMPPVIMSTLAIIVSFAPMFFITGMMGPYMAPMAINVPLTVTFSTLWALTVVPWLCYRLLKGRAPKEAAGRGGEKETGQTTPPALRRAYQATLEPFLARRSMRWALAGAILLALAASVALVALRQVPVKMLPFDNKNEFQLVLDLPEGTTLETTDRAVRSLERYLAGVPEVVNFTSYVGGSSPMDFNGMVRHYYLRRGGHVADIRVNLAPKDRREQQSHEILLRLRKDLQAIAARHGVNLKLVELPPGPPVLATVVAEIHGEPGTPYAELIKAASQVRQVMHAEDKVVDIDDSTEAQRPRWNFVVDKEKASLHGISAAQITATLRLALSGDQPATVHLAHERQPLPVELILPRISRASLEELSQLPMATAQGGQVPLGELGRFVRAPARQPVMHKDLRPVVMVYAELAGRSPATAILDMEARLDKVKLPPGVAVAWDGEGEWHITLRVFRDLGLAFGAALVGIFILLVVQTGSFLVPILLMLAIPLTLLGIMPGFWLLNLVAGDAVAGWPNPVFFTATSMIGMIALGGIVIRNSVVLIEFVHNEMDEGSSFKEAVLASGAVRFRPIVLTAATTALGAWPITLDPIFSGLAWALIFGLAASTAFSLLVVPVAYYALYNRRFGGSGAEA